MFGTITAQKGGPLRYKCNPGNRFHFFPQFLSSTAARTGHEIASSQSEMKGFLLPWLYYIFLLMFTFL